jgi:hypothetical protein
MVSVNTILESPTRTALESSQALYSIDTSNTAANNNSAYVVDPGFRFGISNLVRCTFSVFVDCLSHDSKSSPDQLLELVFNTDFYFNISQDVINNPGAYVTFSQNYETLVLSNQSNTIELSNPNPDNLSVPF